MKKSERDKIIDAYQRLVNAVKSNNYFEIKTPFGTNQGYRITEEDYETLNFLFKARSEKKYTLTKDTELTVSRSCMTSCFYRNENGNIIVGVQFHGDVTELFTDFNLIIEWIYHDYKRFKLKDLYEKGEQEE